MNSPTEVFCMILDIPQAFVLVMEHLYARRTCRWSSNAQAAERQRRTESRRQKIAPSLIACYLCHQDFARPPDGAPDAAEGNSSFGVLSPMLG